MRKDSYINGYLLDEENLEVIKDSGIKYIIIDGEAITEFDPEYEYLFSDEEYEELNFDTN